MNNITEIVGKSAVSVSMSNSTLLSYKNNYCLGSKVVGNSSISGFTLLRGDGKGIKVAISIKAVKGRMAVKCAKVYDLFSKEGSDLYSIQVKLEGGKVLSCLFHSMEVIDGNAIIRFSQDRSPDAFVGYPNSMLTPLEGLVPASDTPESVGITMADLGKRPDEVSPLPTVDASTPDASLYTEPDLSDSGQHDDLYISVAAQPSNPATKPNVSTPKRRTVEQEKTRLENAKRRVREDERLIDYSALPMQDQRDRLNVVQITGGPLKDALSLCKTRFRAKVRGSQLIVTAHIGTEETNKLMYQYLTYIIGIEDIKPLVFRFKGKRSCLSNISYIYDENDSLTLMWKLNG